MAAWLLKGVLQLFIILHLSYFLSAQFLDYPTAQVSTSWTNNDNDLSVVNITSASSLYMRIILLKEIPDSAGTGFACGFLSNEAHDFSVFAIVIVYFGEEQYWYNNDVVWFANGNKPVRENATLQLLPDGDLVLRDVDGTPVWSTNTSNMSVVGMKIMETGNLVLYNGDNKTVWNSSHYPADYPTAQVATSWTNNDPFMINITASYGSPVMRNILFKEIPDTQTGFACGFLSNEAYDSFVFAIGKVRLYEALSLSTPDVVWFANGNKPVRDNATLQLLPDGDLVLRDVGGALVWSTNTSNMSVVGMKIMETGNLVLYNADNKTVWQSFDHPAAEYPTAQVSTSWTNNNLYVVNFTAIDVPFMRSILFKEIPHTRTGFSCGFLSNEAYDSFVFVIGIVQIVKSLYLSKPDVVWYANRNKPVRENATLQLLQDGDLVLRDVDGTLVWSTNTSNKSVVGMKIMDTGNLVLYNADNMTVWQSFDHPADTLLPGQKLLEGQKLVANVSVTNWTEGTFYLSVTSQGLFAFFQSNMPQMYFKFLVRETRRGTEPSYVRSINGTLALFISSAEPSEPDAVFSKPLINSTVHYMRFDHDGHFRLYGVENGPVDLLPVSECDYPTVCGNYRICSNGRQCTCPGGFDVSNDQVLHGCSEISPTTCQNAQSHSLLQLNDVYYFSYVDNNAAVLRGTDVESCKQACSKNCSCKIALFRYYYNFSHGNCFLPSPVLSLIGDGKERSVYKSSAFIKISMGQENGNESASKSGGRTGIVAGSSLGALFIVFLVISFWIVFWRKKKNTEEDEEDYLDQVSGMPMRFSYEELKVATGDFQEKLGEGGFGSVFEGSLGNGVKIAVKRLDGSGQGKKEFLAEVKTIGSIHHVNLARLIGFCAEKSQRLLVYEFMCNGSLDKWIFHTNPVRPTLDWQSIRKIILDIARALAYLHEECRQRIVHLDIKPQNILLDADFHAKVSDFGLSKLIDREQSHVVTMMRGTPGYMAPEWLSSVITEKVDVYSFGIVVMEMVCGRKNIDRSQPEEYVHLLGLFMRKAKEDQLIDMVDKYSEDMQLNGTEAVEMMRVAAWCLQSDFNRRPSMSRAVKVLEGTMDIEVDIDYSFSNPTTMAAIKRETELCATATLLPSILSGPR